MSAQRQTRGRQATGGGPHYTMDVRALEERRIADALTEFFPSRTHFGPTKVERHHTEVWRMR